MLGRTNTKAGRPKMKLPDFRADPATAFVVYPVKPTNRMKSMIAGLNAGLRYFRARPFSSLAPGNAIENVMSDRTNISTRISAARKALGITQEELAERAGVTSRTIQRLENAESTPRAFTLRKIADVLGLELSELTINQEPVSTTVNAGTDEDSTTGTPKSEDLPVSQRAASGEDDIHFLRLLCLSCFSYIVVPYVHFLIPIHLLRRNKMLRPEIRMLGKRIILYQVYWVVTLHVALLVTLIANLLLARSGSGKQVSYLIAPGIMYLLNMLILGFCLLRIPKWNSRYVTMP